jgi:hypothetical protein
MRLKVGIGIGDFGVISLIFAAGRKDRMQNGFKAWNALTD